VELARGIVGGDAQLEKKADQQLAAAAQTPGNPTSLIGQQHRPVMLVDHPSLLLQAPDHPGDRRIADLKDFRNLAQARIALEGDQLLDRQQMAFLGGYLLSGNDEQPIHRPAIFPNQTRLREPIHCGAGVVIRDGKTIQSTALCHRHHVGGIGETIKGKP
jgi:hypothetical protein